MIKNRIRELRARHQMKQEELARRVGVRRETIGNLEKSKMCIRDSFFFSDESESLKTKGKGLAI